jgi:hypothetical protein
VGELAQHPASDGKTPRAVRIDDLVAEVGRLVGAASVPAVYRERVLAQRTRRFEIGAAGKPVEILHTLLGIELKIGKRRLLCPDLATARYLRVFARLGVGTIAVPYDITQVSRVADELESAWHRTVLLADHLTAGRSNRLRALVQARLVALARDEIERHGAGAARPTFVQNTRQRRRRDEA